MFCEKCGHPCNDGEMVGDILYLCETCVGDFAAWCKAMDGRFIGYEFTEYLSEAA